MRRAHLTNQEVNDLNEMFENELKTKEIADLTGLSEVTVRRWKKIWLEERKTESTVEVKKEPEQKQEIIEPSLANSDYAKAYLAGDPVVIRTSFSIERTIRIRSNKTGILYELDNEQKDKVITITLVDGTKFDLDLKTFEKFVDEGVDVYIEMTKKTT